MTAEEARKLSDAVQNRELELKSKRLEKFKNSKQISKIIKRMGKLIAERAKNTNDRIFFYSLGNLRTLSEDEMEYAKNEILSHYKDRGFVAYISITNMYCRYDDIVISWKKQEGAV